FVDDGQTWSEETPEGLTAIEEGDQQTSPEGDLFDDSGNDTMPRIDEGELRYSLAGGQTWILTETDTAHHTGSIEDEVITGTMTDSSDGGDTWITDPTQ